MNTVLYRPVNEAELELVRKALFKGFPPRLPEQPFFYPVTNEQYAAQITKEWNVPAYGKGYVLKFEVNSEYLSQFDVQCVGGDEHTEYWIPSERMEEFNGQIIGQIEIVNVYI